ncbi:hypothetical protein LWI29_005897 [Acer saccharum]|uniref:Uncharacterized protein n=1 Tax=Acer saccharum TaxID=4024 RepID=A0AA39T2N1_ACESA|nr:hypothetical protein LWI29_005897 [Acer saccharum]
MILSVVDLKYDTERIMSLPNARLGLRECPEDEARIEALEGGSTNFGAWLRASGSEAGKLKSPNQGGRNSSGNEEGKFNLPSDGSLRGTDDSRTGPNIHHSSEGVESGGSLRQVSSKLVDSNRNAETQRILSHDRVPVLSDSPLISDVDTSIKNQGLLTSGVEQEQEGAIVAMEDVENYFDNPVLGVQGDNHTLIESSTDKEGSGKSNVRTWKRVARGSSSSVQPPDLGHKLVKRKQNGDQSEVYKEAKKARNVLPLDTSLISAEPEDQARREP